MNTLHDQLVSKDATMSVVGLGYVGLPIALAFAKHLRVIGFDIHEGRVEMMKRGEDPSEEVEPEGFEGCDITFTANADDLKQANFHQEFQMPRHPRLALSQDLRELRHRQLPPRTQRQNAQPCVFSSGP